MARRLDFQLSRREAGLLTIPLHPPMNVSGLAFEFTLLHRFGGTSGLVRAVCASGFNGTSGLTLLDGARGVFSVPVRGVTSGLDPKNYAFEFWRTSSGSETKYVEGFLTLTP